MPAAEPERSRLVESIQRQLEARPEVVFACLHGSFQTGGPYRDIDVAIWVDPARVPRGAMHRYALDLSVDLHLSLRQPVDVQVLNDASLAFRYHALRGQPIVVREREFLDETRARTWDDYFDFQPFARQYLREVLSA